MHATGRRRPVGRPASTDLSKAQAGAPSVPICTDDDPRLKTLYDQIVVRVVNEMALAVIGNDTDVISWRRHGQIKVLRQLPVNTGSVVVMTDRRDLVQCSRTCSTPAL
jgi:hypothetical protein